MNEFDFTKIIKLLSFDEKNPLLFNSGFFLFFFFIFLVTFLVASKTDKFRLYFITVFSLYFFYKTCGWYVAFVIISALIDFKLSRWIYFTHSTLKKRLLLYTSISLNLGLLFYFKYTNFFIELLNNFSNNQIEFLKLILPVGISFYTFENLSYTLDVYDNKIKPVNRFIDYLFFLSFFPKLMMGPIVRAGDFIPQIRKPFSISEKQIGEGLYLITSGLIKKVVISDFLNINYVQNIFDNPAAHTGLECLVAVYSYAIVIYCDFSGYSDIAIGIAKWIGFEININFLSPYQSKSITEFWRRWHISLSQWLKDYLYIRWLGGNQKGTVRKNLNLLITMLLGGFWHGASWNFIFWGGLHGIGLIIDKKRISVFEKIVLNSTQKKLINFLGVFITFNFVCLTWIFFRCNSFSESFIFINQIITNFRADVIVQFLNNYYPIVAMLVFGIILHAIPLRTEDKYKEQIIKLPVIVKAIYFLLCLLIVIQFKQSEIVKPIYLQF